MGFNQSGEMMLPLINCDIRDEVVLIIKKLKTIGIFQLCLTNNIIKPPSLSTILMMTIMQN